MSRDVLVKPQPMPVPGKKLIKEEIRSNFGGVLYDDVLEDCVYKMEASEDKYGSPLMTENGRVAALDAYTDLIDTLNYLVQEHQETDDIDDRIGLQIELYRLNRVAGSIRYRLVQKGLLPNEYRDIAKELQDDLQALKDREPLNKFVRREGD